MPASIEIGARKGIDIEIALAAERAFYFLVPVDDQCCHFYALDRQGVVDQSFRIAGFDLIADKVLPGYGDQGRIVFVEDLHPVLQDKTHEPKPVLQEIVEEIFMY